MADNLGYTQGSGSTVATEEVTTLNGVIVSAQHAQRIAPVIVTANSTAVDITGDQANGIDVDVTRVSGNVTVVQATSSNLKADANITNASLTVAQATAANLNATVTGTVTANAGTGNFTVAQATAANLNATVVGSGNFTVVQPTAANLNATVTGTVTANAGSGSFTVAQATAGSLNATVVQATAANLNATATLAAGTNYVGRVRLTDGTNDLITDTAYNDAESATENHLNVGAKISGLNSAGTFDVVRVNTTSFKSAQYTTAQTSTALWTPAAGKAVVVTGYQIQSFGTTAGTCVVYFGTAAFARGTNLPVFDGEFVPSATLKERVVAHFTVPIRGAANDVVRVTTTGAQSVTIVVYGYEI